MLSIAVGSLHCTVQETDHESIHLRSADKWSIARRIACGTRISQNGRIEIVWLVVTHAVAAKLVDGAQVERLSRIRVAADLTTDARDAACQAFGDSADTVSHMQTVSQRNTFRLTEIPL